MKYYLRLLESPVATEKNIFASNELSLKIEKKQNVCIHHLSQPWILQ